MSELTFAETPEYQQKVLAQMLVAPHFKDVASSALTSEDFTTRTNQWFFEAIAGSQNGLSAITLKEELLRAAKAKTIPEDMVPRYVEAYRIIAQAPTPAETEYVTNHLIRFVRTQACKRAVLDSVDLLKEGEFGEIEKRIVAAANAGVDLLSNGLDYFGEYQGRIARRVNREIERKLSTGIPELDEATYGGLKTKQLGLAVGGTGRGKSLFLQWLAKVAVVLGKRVVYYTFELSEEDMADRFDALFAHIKPHDLQDHSATALKELSKYHKRFGSSLFIKEYPEDEATVHDIRAHITQLTAQGFMPDLVVVDYIDLLKPHRTYNDVTHEQTAVIKSLRGLSKSLNTRIWTACQLNRSGMAMETPDESAIAGGISRLFTCDIALFMAQTNDEREDEEMRLIIQKNRNGRAGKTLKLDTEYEFLTFYREKPLPEEETTNDQTGLTNQPGPAVPDNGDMQIL
jgi:replicative DNA helicase